MDAAARAAVRRALLSGTRVHVRVVTTAKGLQLHTQGPGAAVAKAAAEAHLARHLPPALEQVRRDAARRLRGT